MCLSAAALLAVAGSLAPVAATPYTLTPVNVPGASGTEAFGINAAGQAVGWSF